MFISEARLLDGSLLAGPGAEAQIRAHAIEDFPRESIGYIDPAGEYHRLSNVAPNPLIFAMPPMAQLGALMAQGRVRALCHSHPGGPDCPSEPDMRWQRDLELPFVIVSTNGHASTEPFAWGDELLDQRPLVGRPFRHAVDDCYAMIRAWYRVERGVILPEYPRNWEWWLESTPGEKDLYRRYFADAGFHKIRASQVREGDCFLAMIRSDVPNHAGVYLDGGLALHHPSSGLPHDPSRLSKRDSVARWQPMITHWLRRE